MASSGLYPFELCQNKLFKKMSFSSYEIFRRFSSEEMSKSTRCQVLNQMAKYVRPTSSLLKDIHKGNRIKWLIKYMMTDLIQIRWTYRPTLLKSYHHLNSTVCHKILKTGLVWRGNTTPIFQGSLAIFSSQGVHQQQISVECNVRYTVRWLVDWTISTLNISIQRWYCSDLMQHSHSLNN